MDALNVQQPANICSAPAEPGEEWRQISHDNINPMYWISSKGRVWNNDKHWFLTPRIRPTGYHEYSLQLLDCTPTRKLSHRLVARYFLPVPEDGKDVVDHIDGNPGNNDMSNLRWCDPKGNIHNPNTKPHTIAGCRAVAAMKGHAVVCEGFAEPFPTAKALAEKLGVIVGQVRYACRTGEPVGERKGWNNGKGFHVHYLMNEFDAKQKPVTLADAIKAAQAVGVLNDAYMGKPVLCVEDSLPFPSATSAARAYGMTAPALMTNKQRTDSGTSKLCAKKGFRTTHHFASMSREDYLKWVDEHVPKAV